MSHNIDDLLEEIEILKGYKHMHQKLNEQNKRYREVIDRAMSEGVTTEDCNEAIDCVYGILGEALEGEE